MAPLHLITDNVLVAYESVHALQKKKKCKRTFCAVKLDMLKTDRVERHYLETMLYKLGFTESIIRVIMKCASSVRFTVNVDGERLHVFTPSGGL